MLIFLFCLLAPAREGDSTPHIVPAKVGLVLIGTTQDGFVLATDGSSLNADGRVSQEQKLFQLGKNGALALSGTVSIQDPIGGRVREEVNVARIAAAWSAAHPEADVQTAEREINSEIAAALNKYLSTRDPGAERGRFKFGVIVAGFNDDKPVLAITKYFLPTIKGKPARTERTSAYTHSGDLWIFSNSSVPDEILAGKTNGLKAFKNEPAAEKFRSAPKAGLSEQEYVNLFDSILRAAESDEGKKLDGKRAIVASPNRFATVKQDGFAWSKADAK